jgi:hypothetical protein
MLLYMSNSSVCSTNEYTVMPTVNIYVGIMVCHVPNNRYNDVFVKNINDNIPEILR